MEEEELDEAMEESYNHLGNSENYKKSPLSFKYLHEGPWLTAYCK